MLIFDNFKLQLYLCSIEFKRAKYCFVKNKSVSAEENNLMMLIIIMIIILFRFKIMAEFEITSCIISLL